MDLSHVPQSHKGESYEGWHVVVTGGELQSHLVTLGSQQSSGRRLNRAAGDDFPTGSRSVGRADRQGTICIPRSTHAILPKEEDVVLQDHEGKRHRVRASLYGTLPPICENPEHITVLWTQADPHTFGKFSYR